MSESRKSYDNYSLQMKKILLEEAIQLYSDKKKEFRKQQVIKKSKRFLVNASKSSVTGIAVAAGVKTAQSIGTTVPKKLSWLGASLAVGTAIAMYGLYAISAVKRDRKENEMKNNIFLPSRRHTHILNMLKDLQLSNLNSADAILKELQLEYKKVISLISATNESEAREVEKIQKLTELCPSLGFGYLVKCVEEKKSNDETPPQRYVSNRKY